MFDYLSDPTGVKREREGMKAKVAAENRLREEQRQRMEALGQQYQDTAGQLSGQYDFLSGRIPGDVARLEELATQGRPTYQGTTYTKTAQDFLDPSLDFQREQAARGIESGAAARGNLLSGKAQKELMQSAQKIGEQGYADAFARMERDRRYMTDEEKRKYDTEAARYGDLYKGAEDLTKMSLGGLGTQTELGKWGTTGDVRTRMGAEGTLDQTAAGYGDMLRGRQYSDFSKGVFDIAGDTVKSYLKGKF